MEPCVKHSEVVMINVLFLLTFISDGNSRQIKIKKSLATRTFLGLVKGNCIKRMNMKRVIHKGLSVLQERMA